MRKTRVLMIACIVGGLVPVGRADASPIVYSGTLADGVPAFGSISPGTGVSDPESAAYYSFFANAGSLVDLFGDRLDSDYDMGFWLYSGSFSDTSEFGGDLSSGSGLITFADDNDPPNIPGPFGDPHYSFVAGTSGIYTVAVTDVASGSDAGANGLFDFSLTATNIVDAPTAAVPEPTSLALLGFGVAGFGARVMRRRNANKA